MLELWHSRLEAVALAQVAISLLGNIGVPSGTNVAIGMFTYLNCRKEDDQDMMVTAGIHAGSVLADIIILCLHGGEWSSAGHEVAFGMSMFIINMFAKMIALIAMFMVYEEVRRSSFPSSGQPKGKFTEIDDKDMDIGGSYQND
ncbi:hypothetical protein AAMO2058_001213300 [Amorphochlora amoebiformis]